MYRTIRSWTKNQEVKSPSSISHEIFHHYNTLCSWQKVKNAFLLSAAGQVETGRSSPCRCRLLSPRWLRIPWPVRSSACPALPAAHRCPVVEHMGPRQGTVASQVCKRHDAVMLCVHWVWFSLSPDEFSRSSIVKAWAILFQASSSCFPEISALLGSPPSFLTFQAQICLHNCASSRREHSMSENEEEEQTCAASQPPLPFLLLAPLLPFPFLTTFLESLEIWNQHWNYSLQLPPRSQISEETSLSPLLT